MKAISLLLPIAALAQPLAAQIDLNGDGMSDIWAALYAAQALDPTADTDQDGCDNLTESRFGTNPFSPGSKPELRIAANHGTPPVLSWQSVPGKSYQLASSGNLRDWSPTGTPFTGAGEIIPAEITPSASREFWQVIVSDLDADRDGLTAYEEILLGYSDNDRHSSNTGAGTDFAAALNLVGSPGSFQLQGQAVNGSPPTLAESSRFLQQATMGATYAGIESVTTTGIPAWLDSQFAVPATSHVTTNNALTIWDTEGEGELIPVSPFIWTWWDTTMTGPDILRQRVAFALSEIFVIAQTTDELEDFNWGVATYYDLLVNNAFGNYRDLLYAISRNPAMGHFLSHVKNRPTDPASNIFPDENYAREVMQLFSIGLFELNQDGSRKKDANGNDIPTYDNSDITEFARVFTGLTFNPQNPNNGTPWENDDPGPVLSLVDYLEANDAWMGIEMVGYEPMHESGVKNLLNGASTNGTLQQDLDAAIDNLFNHPNIGPFIGRLLIQRLVTSNPSPDYIHRVAAAFNDNGSGGRGDMKAVIRAILLDPEARNRSFINNPWHGKLREPVLRHTQLARAFGMRPETGRFLTDNFEAATSYAQQPMKAPSVFNFYLPDHQPPGPIKDAGLVAPEFQITTATTTIKTLNFFSSAIPFDYLISIDEEWSGGTEVEVIGDYSTEITLIENNDIAGLIDRLDILLTRGQMQANTRSALQTALTGAANAGTDPEDLARFAVTLVASSPDFAVLR